MGSPFSQAGGHASQAQERATQPGLRRAESGPGPLGSTVMPDSSTTGSPTGPRRKQSLHRSRSGSSPPGRMSLGRSRGSREDTPDPRAVPPEYSGPLPTDKLAQDPPPLLHQPPSGLVSSSSRRYRRPASAAPVPLSQDRAQSPAQPGSSPPSNTEAQRSLPPNGMQPTIPEHLQAEASRSVVSSQPQQEHGAPMGSKWTLKFRPAPHDPGALSGAPADPVLAVSSELAGQAGPVTQPLDIRPRGAAHLDPAQVQPDGVGLHSSRLSHVHVSGTRFPLPIQGTAQFSAQRLLAHTEQPADRQVACAHVPNTDGICVWQRQLCIFQQPSQCSCDAELQHARDCEFIAREQASYMMCSAMGYHVQVVQAIARST